MSSSRRYRRAGRRRRPFSARNRQRVWLRQSLVRRRRIRRQRSVWRSGLATAGRRRRSGCQTGFHGRIDRGARRHRQFALLDQRGLLRHRRRQCRRGAALPRRSRYGRSQRSPVGLEAKGAAGNRWRRPVDDGVDDGRIVDVGKDDVVRRRRHIDRRPHKDRDRHEERLRQDEQPDRRRRRLQHDEIRRRRRQEEYRRRRWRHEVEVGIAERQHRTIDIDELFRRRRRHVVVDDLRMPAAARARRREWQGGGARRRRAARADSVADKTSRRPGCRRDRCGAR